MKIHIPNSAFLGNIDPFLRNFDDSDRNHLFITSNKKWISIHPVVLCMVAALGLSVGKDNISYEEFEAKSKHYLERMGLFKLLGIKSGINIKKHAAAGRFIPVSQIKNSKSLTKFITEMIPLLHLEPKYVEPIRFIISELGRNVLEHAEAKEGAILCAQYYKKSNSIRIGIVDNGLGIHKTINYSHYAKDDLTAIQLALTPGITGTTHREGGTEQNAGAGLFFIKSIASINQDHFMVYSGHAMYKLLKQRIKKRLPKLHADPFRDKHSKSVDLPFWQGTAIGIDLKLDENEEFTTLLEMIKDTYSTAVRQRKKTRYKKPKFI